MVNINKKYGQYQLIFSTTNSIKINKKLVPFISQPKFLIFAFQSTIKLILLTNFHANIQIKYPHTFKCKIIKFNIQTFITVKIMRKICKVLF